MILLWFLVILLALAWGLADTQLRQPIQRPPPPAVVTPAKPPPPPPEPAADTPVTATPSDSQATDKPQ